MVASTYTNRRLTAEDMDDDVRRLFSSVLDDGFDPDVIVGIPTAGSYLAVSIHEQFPGRHIVEVGASRSSTKWKRAAPVAAMVRVIPSWVQDLLRKVEHLVLTRKPRKAKRAPRQVTVSMTDRAVLTSLKEPDVLVVDDAVDTGETLRAVTAFLRDLLPDCRLRTAVLSVTAPELEETADHHLYSQVLLSGPWSLDER